MKKEKTNYAKELEASFKTWDDIYLNGCSDPFWSDGVNLNLVRNHIIYAKEILSKSEATLFGMPDSFYRDTPPEVANDYMAAPDRIRHDANESLKLFLNNKSLQYIRDNYRLLSGKAQKSLCIFAVMGYADTLQQAINDDDLLTMRRYRTVTHYLESFDSVAMKMQSTEVLARIEEQSELNESEEENEEPEEPEETVEADTTDYHIYYEVISAEQIPFDVTNEKETQENEFNQLTFF